MISVATWVGYDLDGRDDINWIDSFCIRLLEKVTAIESYLKQLKNIKEAAGITKILSIELERTAAFNSDLQKIQAIDPNICVFVPSVETIYPNGATVKKYDLQGLDKLMEGRHRPGHFDGVATVVERLFTLIQPDVAYFGQKDFQQLQIVSLLAESMGIKICSLPTVREQNGLAMSSRNLRLSTERREEAKLIYEILGWVKSNFSSHSIVDLKEMVIQKLSKTPVFELEYFEIASEKNLKSDNSKVEGESYRAFIAVVVDGVRLIDNMSLN